ncbi:hypothetical protein [Limimaricola cinnabarinus]|uniref:hypothetical protein n=1 Tax=Limimaricola cinnabarinus TaxID=1125964 RepID=UPI0005EC9B90|nr:hypothetical protein [Limimaricola cinnabarinus]
MTLEDKAAREEAEIQNDAKLLLSGDPLTRRVLARHLAVDDKTISEVLKRVPLRRELGTYPWRRIWQTIHKTEGRLLPDHLDALQKQHPSSPILSGITDLAFALRMPLIDFAEMAQALDKKPDSLSKAMKRGATLPFPTLELGVRLRRYRPLEVRLWVEEEIKLDLPSAFEISTAALSKPPAETVLEAPVPDKIAANTPAKPIGQRAFAGNSRNRRTSPE